ncbi:MAG: hypothetical protein AB7F79_12050 [Steroidobacteraceae bacterium]
MLYAGTDKDSVTIQVRSFLNLPGITDIEFAYAEGLNINADSREQALRSACQCSVTGADINQRLNIN